MKYEGYHEDKDLPVKPGDLVTIKKGVVVHSLHPKKKQWVAGRTYKVRVDHVLSGSSSYDYRGGLVPATNPTVRWAGEGKYWCWVDINDLPEVEERQS